MQNTRLDEAKPGIKIARRNINNLRYAEDTTLMAESKEELKTSWWKWKRRVRKAGLKLNFQKTDYGIRFHHFMANRLETMETVTDFIFLGCKITADDDCSLEMKRRLLLGRRSMTNQENILKSRNIILPTKVHIVKTMVFPVVLYGFESWTIKKAEYHWTPKNWCFWTVVLEKTLESPLDCKEVRPVSHTGNQS